MKNFVEELKWRGMIQDIMPGTRGETDGRPYSSIRRNRPDS